MLANKRDIYITSSASWLPDSMSSITTAIASGEYAQSDAEEMCYENISIAPKNITVMDMAAEAANRALKKANTAGSQLEMLTYNAIHHHGHPQLWCPASYLQRILHAESAMPLSIYQGCDGQLLSIAMLSRVLQTSEKNYALSVAADKFSNGGINRWHGDYGIVYGDAATAVVLSKINGIAKILDLQSAHNPALESLHRFDQAYDVEEQTYFEKQYNVRSAKKNFLTQHGKDFLIQATHSAMRRLWNKIFSKNTTSPEDIRFFIFPNLAKNVLDKNYFPIYTDIEKKSLWKFGKQVGHLGASDCIAGLTYLIESQEVHAGDKILCIGAGSGFSWSFMLIEML